MPNFNGLIECNTVMATGDINSPYYLRANELGVSKSVLITSTMMYSLSTILEGTASRAKVIIEACGGGGGGSGDGDTPLSGYTGGGGGGSGYIETLEGIFPSDYTFNITIGAGGAGGAIGSNGAAGGTTIVANVLDTSRPIVADPVTVLLDVSGGSGGIGGTGGAGYFGGGGSSSAMAPAPGGSGGAGIIPAYNGQAGDASPNNTGTGLPGSGAGVASVGNFGYSDDRNNYAGGGGGGGIQRQFEGKGGSGDNYGAPTAGAPGCGGGGAACGLSGMLTAGAKGGDGYVQLTVIPLA